MNVIIYHEGYDPKTRLPVYEKRVYQGTVYRDNRVAVNEKGLVHANVYKIRIFTIENVLVSNGDKLVIGEESSDIPPKDAKLVISYSDNRNPRLSKGVWHWRIECG